MKTKDANTAADLKKHYRRGYQAGYEKGTRQKDTVKALERNEDRRDRFFCAALTGLLATSQEWKQGEKRYSDVPGYVKLARSFAEEAMRQVR